MQKAEQEMGRQHKRMDMNKFEEFLSVAVDKKRCIDIGATSSVLDVRP